MEKYWRPFRSTRIFEECVHLENEIATLAAPPRNDIVWWAGRCTGVGDPCRVGLSGWVGRPCHSEWGYIISGRWPYWGLVKIGGVEFDDEGLAGAVGGESGDGDGFSVGAPAGGGVEAEVASSVLAAFGAGDGDVFAGFHVVDGVVVFVFDFVSVDEEVSVGR